MQGRICLASIWEDKWRSKNMRHRIDKEIDVMEQREEKYMTM